MTNAEFENLAFIRWEGEVKVRGRIVSQSTPPPGTVAVFNQHDMQAVVALVTVEEYRQDQKDADKADSVDGPYYSLDAFCIFDDGTAELCSSFANFVGLADSKEQAATLIESRGR